MTADFVAFHAAERPRAVALVNNGEEITYARFYRDIRRVERALRELGLSPGATVAIECADTYFHWLLRIAFEELGVVTASLPAQADLSSYPFLRSFDLVISEAEGRAAGVRKHDRPVGEWLPAVLARPDEGEIEVSGFVKKPDDPLRILYTSGTTGLPKRLLYRRWLHERTIAKVMWFNRVTPGSRYLLVVPFSVAGSYSNATACIRSGGTVVADGRMATAEAISAYRITHTTLPPIHLKNVVDELPLRFQKPDELTIFSFGAAVSKVLHDKALARLATEVCDMYGSNEAGFISSRRASGDGEFGCIWPGIRVEIVDDRDERLPPGRMGHIRVKTDCMADGYIDDSETTQRMFRDGWFYAGDLGILHGATHLQVVGRSDDVLNIGWRKVPPDTLEDLIATALEGADVGVCSVPNRDGIEEICVVVAGWRGDDRDLLERIERAFQSHHLGGRFHVAKVDGIPRNANGKILRNDLKTTALGLMGR